MFKLRPHHLVCNYFFQGKGYDPNFINNFSSIKKTLLDNPDTKQIQLIGGSDDVCVCCPKNRGGRCKGEAETLLIDNSYLDLLQLSIGKVYSYNDAKTKIEKFLTIDNFRKICNKCPWKNFCELELITKYQN